MKEIKSKNELDEIVKDNELVLVKYFADWCMPCKMMAPMVKEVSVDYEGKIPFTEVNVDEVKELAMEHGVRNIPTMLLLKDGEVIDKIIGAVPKTKITEVLDKHLN